MHCTTAASLEMSDEPKNIYVPKAAVIVYKTLRGRSNMLTKLLIANLTMRLFEIIAGY